MLDKLAAGGPPSGMNTSSGICEGFPQVGNLPPSGCNWRTWQAYRRFPSAPLEPFRVDRRSTCMAQIYQLYDDFAVFGFKTPGDVFVNDLFGTSAEQCGWQDGINLEVIVALTGVPVDESDSMDSTEEPPMLVVQVVICTQEAAVRMAVEERRCGSGRRLPPDSTAAETRGLESTQVSWENGI